MNWQNIFGFWTITFTISGYLIGVVAAEEDNDLLSKICITLFILALISGTLYFGGLK